jgi:hypothetical protein
MNCNMEPCDMKKQVIKQKNKMIYMLTHQLPNIHILIINPRSRWVYLKTSIN